MAGIYDYSSVAADNGLVGGINIAEFCPAGNLNNGMRAIMADLAVFLQAPILGGTTINGTIGVSGGATLGDDVSIDGALSTTGLAQIGGALSTGGNATVNGNILLNQPSPTIMFNSGGPRIASPAASRLAFYEGGLPDQRLSILPGGVVQVGGARNIGTGDIQGSGNFRAIAGWPGGYAISTYDTQDYVAIQFVRDISGTAVMEGYIFVSGSGVSITYTSDASRKTGFDDFDSGAIIDGLNFGTFRWREDDSEGFGVIAQEAEPVFPYAVRPSDEPGNWGVDYIRFVPVLGNQLKKLRARIADLEARVAAITSTSASCEEGGA